MSLRMRAMMMSIPLHSWVAMQFWETNNIKVNEGIVWKRIMTSFIQWQDYYLKVDSWLTGFFVNTQQTLNLIFSVFGCLWNLLHTVQQTCIMIINTIYIWRISRPNTSPDMALNKFKSQYRYEHYLAIFRNVVVIKVPTVAWEITGQLKRNNWKKKNSIAESKTILCIYLFIYQVLTGKSYHQ